MSSSCASTDQNTKCVVLPDEVQTVEGPAGCDNEQTVASKVETLRARHIAGELNADKLYAEQGAVIDGACFKAYLPLIEDDMSPMGLGPAGRLRKLKSLLDAGIVNQREFDEKKKEILTTL